MMSTASYLRNLAHVSARPLAKMRCRVLYLFGVFVLLTPAVCIASDAEGELRSDAALRSKPLRLSIEGISASVGEDEPRVLTILPWRAPTLPRRPRAELENSAPDLVQPLDPLALGRHREFRRSLGVTHPGGRQ